MCGLVCFDFVSGLDFSGLRSGGGIVFLALAGAAGGTGAEVRAR